MIATKRAVAAIIYNEDRTKILLLKRGPECRNETGKWENPGGHLDPNAVPEARIKEKVWEEIGVKINISRKLFTNESKPDNTNTVWIADVFDTAIESGDPTPKQEAYCSEVKWFSLEELEHCDLASYTQKDFIQLGYLKKRIKQGTAVIIFDAEEKRILLVKRGELSRNEQGKWENPGGELLEHESSEDGIKREVMEEIKVELQVEEILFTDEGESDDNVLWQIEIYKGKILSGIPDPQSSENCSEAKWYNISELNKVDLTTYTRRDFIRLGYING